MRAESQNPNIKVLDEMENLRNGIKNNNNELKIYLNNIIESENIKKFDEEFKYQIVNLSTSINVKKSLKDKQIYLNDLKQAFRNYYTNILLVYENTFIKK
jgi:copper homeostasis protein CutC